MLTQPPLNRIFVILNISEVSKVDFNQVEETDVTTIRKSIDGKKTFIKYESGSTPSFLSNLTTKEGPYTYYQMLDILNGSDWSKQEDIFGNLNN
jgi:hypothetical protein